MMMMSTILPYVGRHVILNMSLIREKIDTHTIQYKLSVVLTSQAANHPQKLSVHLEIEYILDSWRGLMGSKLY